MRKKDRVLLDSLAARAILTHLIRLNPWVRSFHGVRARWRSPTHMRTPEKHSQGGPAASEPLASGGADPRQISDSPNNDNAHSRNESNTASRHTSCCTGTTPSRMFAILVRRAPCPEAGN
ncbi:hypothetical protein BX600DRAFT_242092 [Xylariales sp. PMI_506]|nr:hypothetical protein BX600DRAFT_242092 [Xylariales sp. PMI_506]